MAKIEQINVLNCGSNSLLLSLDYEDLLIKDGILTIKAELKEPYFEVRRLFFTASKYKITLFELRKDTSVVINLAEDYQSLARALNKALKSSNYFTPGTDRVLIREPLFAHYLKSSPNLLSVHYKERAREFFPAESVIIDEDLMDINGELFYGREGIMHQYCHSVSYIAKTKKFESDEVPYLLARNAGTLLDVEWGYDIVAKSLYAVLQIKLDSSTTGKSFDFCVANRNNKYLKRAMDKESVIDRQEDDKKLETNVSIRRIKMPAIDIKAGEAVDFSFVTLNGYPAIVLPFESEAKDRPIYCIGKSIKYLHNDVQLRLLPPGTKIKLGIKPK